MTRELTTAAGFAVTAAPHGDEATAFARAEMERYLTAILGCSPGEKGTALRLSWAEDPDLGDEGYALTVEPSGSISLRGGGPAGLVYGVYDFLRRFGGCRFSGLGPDGEYVPRRERIMLPEKDYRRKPRLWYRGLQFSAKEPLDLTRQRIDWMAKNGMNYVMVHPRPDRATGTAVAIDPATGRRMVTAAGHRYDEAYVREVILPEMRKRGLKLDMNHHNLFFWLPPEVYFAQHPEWYALRDGRRSTEHRQLCLCTSQPEAVATLIENIKTYLRRTPEARLVGVIPEDGLGMCQCDACCAQDPDPRDAFRPPASHRSRDAFNAGKIRRYVLLLNTVARAIREEFPGVRVGAAAYVDLQWPDPGIRLEKNIVPWLAIYWRCGAHPLEHDACPMNDLFRKLIEEWRAYHQGPLILYEYYMGMNSQGALPYPQTDVICREWPALKALGIEGATIQSAAGHHNTYASNYLAFARHGWDDHVDAGEVIEDFLLGQFGSLRDAIRPVYEHFEKKARAIERGEADSPFLKPVPPAIGCLLPNARNAAYFLDEEGKALLASCLERAAEAVPSAPEREQRAWERFRVAAQYWRLAAQMLRAGHAVARALETGDAPRAAALAEEAVQTFEPELDRLEKDPPEGWCPAEKIAVWRRRGYECGLAWFREVWHAESR